MPVSSYLENGPPRVKTMRDASEHTRYIRLAAQVAPYIKQANGADVPKGSWKTPSMAANSALIRPVFGVLKSFVPNSS